MWLVDLPISWGLALYRDSRTSRLAPLMAAFTQLSPVAKSQASLWEANTLTSEERVDAIRVHQV